MSQRCELPSPSSRRIRTLSALIAAVVLTALVVSVPASPAGADADWLQTINTYRIQNGRAPLQLDTQLSGLAQQQAQSNASRGALAHTPNLAAGVSAGWLRLGENVGRGTSRELIWNAFLGSAPHTANLLDAGFTHVGIGVVYSGGEEWVVHRFMAVGAPAPPPPEPEPAPEPVYVPPVTQAPAPRVTTPPPTAPPVTVPITTTTTTTIPVPEPVVVPAASAPDRAAALLDALHGIER